MKLVKQTPGALRALRNSGLACLVLASASMARADLADVTDGFEAQAGLIVVGVTAIAIACVAVIGLKVGFSALKSMFARGH